MPTQRVGRVHLVLGPRASKGSDRMQLWCTLRKACKCSAFALVGCSCVDETTSSVRIGGCNSEVIWCPHSALVVYISFWGLVPQKAAIVCSCCISKSEKEGSKATESANSPAVTRRRRLGMGIFILRRGIPPMKESRRRS